MKMYLFIVGEMERAFSNDREQGQDDSCAGIRPSYQRKLQCRASGKKNYFIVEFKNVISIQKKKKKTKRNNNGQSD